MLKRSLSAVIMTIICVIFYCLGGNYFIFFTSLLGILMYKELISLKEFPVVVQLLGLLSLIALIIINSINNYYFSYIKNYTIIFNFVLLLPSLLPKYQKIYLIKDAFYLVGFILFIGISLTSINLMMIDNKLLVLYLTLNLVFNDVFAYIIGSKFGHTKYSNISKNKTVEGNIGGLVFGIIAGVTSGIYFNIIPNISLLVISTLIINISCQLGDLIFSKIKREYNIKDFSNLIPGHGGILDRCDSMLFTSLVFMLIISFI